MSQKRQQEDGKAPSETNSPEDKRRRVPALRNVVQEVMKMQSVQHLLEPVLEPLIRRVVKEEIDLALRKHLNNMKRASGKEVNSPESRSLQLQFENNLSLPVFTGARIEGDESSPLKIALFDAHSGQIVNSGRISSAKVEVVVLEGDFETEENDTWALEEFKNNIVKEREGKKSLLMGDAFLTLKEGIGLVGEISFTDNSSWTRSRKFRLGARVVDNFDGIRVREAKTESFIVRDHRGELYKKHHPPDLFDEVWRLEKIGKDGAFHKRLSRENIHTVKDFLTLLSVDPPRLRHILGTGMSPKMWEVTLEHARTCNIDKRMYLYSPSGCQRKSGVVFNVVGQVMGLLSECQYVPIDKLSESEKADSQNLVIYAFEHWEEVVSFDDEASLMGSSSVFTNVLHSSSSPKMENASGSNMNGLDDYALHGIENMALTYDQPGFPAHVTNSLMGDMESMTQAFCDEDHLRFFNSDLHSQNMNLDSPADLQSAVDDFLLARSTEKAQRRWT
ncbi:Calmodulin_bind domain-containing protein, partial [Cephalotus follicularis]